MQTIRVVLSALAMLCFALLLLARPAAAQEGEDEGGKKTIIIELDGDGDRRVIVDGRELDDEEAEAYLDGLEGEIRGPHVFRGRPGDKGSVVFRHRLGEDPALHFREMMDDPVVFDMKEYLGPDGVVMDRLFGRLHGEWGGGMQGHAEIARMDAETRQLAREARRAEGAERQRLEQTLREKLDEIFERKQALRAERIERLRRELDEVEAEQTERAEFREDIIGRRLKELLGERDKYDW